MILIFILSLTLLIMKQNYLSFMLKADLHTGFSECSYAS